MEGAGTNQATTASATAAWPSAQERRRQAAIQSPSASINPTLKPIGMETCDLGDWTSSFPGRALPLR